MLSMEALFWTPLGMDLLLLATTYSCCRFQGLEWYLKTISEQAAASKKNDDEATTNFSASNPIHSVWDLAMIAYSSYGCLLPWAAYVCYIDPSHRTSCAWAMTNLMMFKLMSVEAWKWTNKDSETKSKVLSIIFFYLPTYGGYAIYNTFLKKN